MGLMLEVAAHIVIPDHELHFTYARSSGPGGQNVNKVNSKAVLRWNARLSPSLREDVRARLLARYGKRLNAEGEFVLSSDIYRDQARNAWDCLEKLRTILLDVAFPPKKRHATKPTRGSKQRRLDGKKKHGQKKADRRRDF